MDSKSIFASKTFWLNILGPAFAYLASKGLQLTPDQQLQTIAGAMALMNIIVRYFTKQSVHVVAPPPAALALFGALLFSPFLLACTAAQDLANACQGMAASLNTASDLRDRGKLPPGSIKTIDIAATVTNPICTSKTPPVDLPSAIAIVTQEVSLVLPLIQGGK